MLKIYRSQRDDIRFELVDVSGDYVGYSIELCNGERSFISTLNITYLTDEDKREFKLRWVKVEYVINDNLLRLKKLEQYKSLMFYLLPNNNIGVNVNNEIL